MHFLCTITRFIASVVCSEIVDPGPCKATILSYYYDHDINQCREFHFGGCYGNHNKFSTRVECEAICAPKGMCIWAWLDVGGAYIL